jgi:DNA uptake protein ComE-like DNA-binding protein
VKEIFRQFARRSQRGEDAGNATRQRGANGDGDPAPGPAALGFDPPRRGAVPPPVEPEAPSDGESGRGSPAKVRQLEAELKRIHAEHERALAEADRRAQDAAERAAVDAEQRLAEALEKQREELERDATRRVEEARREAREEAESESRAREEALTVERAELEAELAAAREQVAPEEDSVGDWERASSEAAPAYVDAPPLGSSREAEARAGGLDRDEPGAAVSLSSASFDDLRALGMSVTQARRVLRFREQQEIRSVEDLEEIPGFPRAFLTELKRMTVP